MRVLEVGAVGENVELLQQALRQEGLLEAEPTGHFDEATDRAVRTWQEKHALVVDGIVGPQTLRSLGGLLPEKEEFFAIGPDRGDDLREARPYFLVPVDTPEQREPVLNRVVEHVAASGKPATDIYILSHGWHRNFYDAVSVYDRLVSRFVWLLRRRRIRPPGPEYHPLFLAIHWHSDPGTNGFWDAQGRRHKASFLRNARDCFIAAQPNARFIADFEHLFEFISRLSAPGIDPFISWELYELNQLLHGVLDKYELQEGPGATIAEKIAVVWRCYHESQAKRPLADQTVAPGRYLTPLGALKALVGFAVGAGALAVLAAPFLNWLLPMVQGWLNALGHIPGANWAAKLSNLWLVLVPFSLIFLLVSAAIAGRGPRRYGEEEREPARPPGLLVFLTWINATLVLVVPLLALCVVTFLLGWLLRGFLLTNERLGKPNEAPRHDGLTWLRPRMWLAWLALIPARLAHRCFAPDDRLAGLVDVVTKQLAFFEMQMKAVETGATAAGLLGQLRVRLREAGAWSDDTRIHLVGHSFGGVVVANTARHLVLQEGFDRLQSVITLQAAMASDWFDRETELRKRIGGLLAAVFTRYDTANSFYYPAANQGRMAMGFVGMCHREPVTMYGRDGRFASLTSPPWLDLPPGTHEANLDASRLCYEGPPAAGGGHDDLFKDDVVNLIWSAMTYVPSS